MNTAPITENDYLTNLIIVLDQQIKKEGICRYDPTDILSTQLFEFTRTGVLRPIWYLLRVFELIAPLLLRKLIGVKKSIAPTTYWHLLQASMNMYEAGYKLDDYPNRVIQLCDDALILANSSEYICWLHPYGIHGEQWRNETLAKDQSIPMSCAHNTARLGLALLRAGHLFHSQKFLKAGLSAANACIKYHNWFWYEDGQTCSVSYYPDTSDEVINTGAEIALLLAEAYNVSGHDYLAVHAHGLLKMILSEQQPDGSWRYCTKAHELRLGPSLGPDNHHHAMVIRVLASFAEGQDYAFLDKQTINKAIIHGIKFYINNLCNKNGVCYLDPRKTREADIAGYCEGLLALQKSSNVIAQFDSKLASEVNLRRNMMVNVLTRRFINQKNFRIISERRYGIPYCIDSIRWGSGLVLEAISSELLNRKKYIIKPAY